MAAKRLYAWEKWFRKSRFVLSRGSDYKCSHLTMAQQIRNAAIIHAKGQEVHIDEGADGKSLTVTTRPRNN